MFKGFKFKLPHYTVVTPQTGQTFDVRSMTVAEVNEAKTSLVTPNKAHSVVNDILFSCLQNKPNHITDPISFKKYVTTQDREALLYGLYHITFGDNREFQVSCSNCGNEQLVKIALSKAFSMNAYPKSESVKKSYTVAKTAGDAEFDPEIEQAISESAIQVKDTDQNIEPGIGPMVSQRPIDKEDDDDGIGVGGSTPKPKEQPESMQRAPKQAPEEQTSNETSNLVDSMSILTERKVIELPISQVVAIIRQPTIWDEEMVLKDLAFASKKHGDLVNETLIIERFEQYEEGNKSPSLLVTTREDVFLGYQSLPPQDKIKILEEYQDAFGQYGIDVKSTYDCGKCGFENDLDINVAAQFFRMVSLS